MGKILVIDDDVQMRRLLAHFLRRLGREVVQADSIREGQRLMEAVDPALTIVDYQLPDGTAFDILETARSRDTQDSVIVLTGLGTIDLAVQAIKAGAEHFLTKPVDLESLEILVRRTLDSSSARRKQAVADAAVGKPPNPFLGSSPSIIELREMAEAVVASEAPVLILGETGTGKSLLARWLHTGSRRAAEAFVDLNCAGLSPELVESELFGHRKGAFTGAIGNKPGLLELAHRGTLFLDEIGDLELAVQPKLLKVLEEGQFRRVGDVTSRIANVRLIAATHRNLTEMVRKEKFREDLLFRVNTLVFHMPALRERAQDIGVIAEVLLRELCRKAGRPEVRLTDEALAMLQRYTWPGNIRELRNVLERALLFARGEQLDRKTLHFDRSLDPEERGAERPRTLDEAERLHISKIIDSVDGRVELASEILGLSRSALYAKLKKFGIKAAV